MLHFETKGTGNKQIIFVHGNSQSLKSWDAVIGHLIQNRDFSLIALDLPGNGTSPRSTNPAEDYLVLNMGLAIKEVVESLKNPEYIIVALSLGTTIVGEVIQELSGCKGAMLVSSCIIGAEAMLETVFLPNPNTAPSFMPNPTDAEIDLLVEDAIYRASGELKKRVKADFKATDPNFRMIIADAITNHKYSDEILNFKLSKVPLALVFGEQEKICRVNYLDKIDFRKWKNKTILIPESGHLCNLDQPDQLAELIREFTEECF